LASQLVKYLKSKGFNLNLTVYPYSLGVMIKTVKSTIVLFVLSFFLARPIYAQETGEGVATFVGSYTLWIAIIIGFVASLMTLGYGRRMQGSRVGRRKIVHDLMFILGYGLMLVGASNIRKIG